jgi:hypothetical protein
MHNIPASLVEIEQRILNKMKKKNNTDRNNVKNISTLNLNSSHAKSRIIYSPGSGSDKSDKSGKIIIQKAVTIVI